MKSFNTLQNAVNLSLVENKIVASDLAPFLKVAKKCTEENNYCDYSIKEVDDGYDNNYFEFYYQLADDSIVMNEDETESSSSITFLVDTNGKKGPNRRCFDYFNFTFDKKTGKFNYYDVDDMYPFIDDLKPYACPTYILQKGNMDYIDNAGSKRDENGYFDPYAGSDYDGYYNPYDSYDGYYN